MSTRVAKAKVTQSFSLIANEGCGHVSSCYIRKSTAFVVKFITQFHGMHT